jgi:hypothetical protein
MAHHLGPIFAQFCGTRLAEARVMRIRPFVPGLLASTLATTAALALPSPMTDEQLLEQSDLVVDATAASAACDGPTTDAGDRYVSTYVTAITVETTVKGTAPEATEVVGYEEEYKQAHPGCAGYTPALPEGFSGRLYLRSNTDGTFSATHYNAFKPDDTSDPQAFVDCGGAGGVGGAAGAAGSAGTGASAGVGGAAGSGATGGNAATPPGDDSGCSTSLGSISAADGALAIAALAIAGALRRRRARTA